MNQVQDDLARYRGVTDRRLGDILVCLDESKKTRASVMTLEPFVGAACRVDIADRKRAACLPIEYATTGRRLNLLEKTLGQPLAA